MKQNGPRFHGNNLLYKTVTMVYAMPDFVPDRGSPSLNTKSFELKTGV